MVKENIEMLQTVANGLEELREQVVFIGGAVAELYADNPGASDIRPTKDIDCVIEVSTRIDYNKFEKLLESKKFMHDTSKGAPICRWVFKDVKVDVMPTQEDILGFSNKWYKKGIENKIRTKLPDNNEIYIFPIEYYLAAKFEAHLGRGGSDLRQSHDFEDIVYLLDNCSNLLEIVSGAEETVRKHLTQQCQLLLNNNNLIEGIECALPIGSDSDSTEIISDLLKSIADLQ